MEIKSAEKRFAELKQVYDKAKMSFEVASRELKSLEEELAKDGLTIDTLDAEIEKKKKEIAKKEKKLAERMDILDGIVTKIKRSE